MSDGYHPLLRVKLSLVIWSAIVTNVVFIPVILSLFQLVCNYVCLFVCLSIYYVYMHRYRIAQNVDVGEFRGMPNLQIFDG